MTILYLSCENFSILTIYNIFICSLSKHGLLLCFTTCFTSAEADSGCSETITWKHSWRLILGWPVTVMSLDQTTQVAYCRKLVCPMEVVLIMLSAVKQTIL